MSKNGISTGTAALVAVVVVLSIATVYGQTVKGSLAAGIDAGPFLFIASGGHETVGGFGLSGEPHIDYFITDELDIGATGFFYHTFDTDPSQPSIFYGGVYGHVNYHFNSGGTWVPYIGFRIGGFKPNTEMQLALGAQTGLRYFVTRLISVDLQLEAATITGSADYFFLSSLGLGVSYHIR
jgi:hypothetical protein